MINNPLVRRLTLQFNWVYLMCLLIGPSICIVLTTIVLANLRTLDWFRCQCCVECRCWLGSLLYSECKYNFCLNYFGLWQMGWRHNSWKHLLHKRHGFPSVHRLRWFQFWTPLSQMMSLYHDSTHNLEHKRTNNFNLKNCFSIYIL